MDNKEDLVFKKKREMSEKDLLIIETELNKKSPNTVVAWVLWFFVGGLGIHAFYLGNKNRGLTYIGLMATTIITYILGFVFLLGGESSGGFIALGILLFVLCGVAYLAIFVVWIIDAVGMTKAINKKKTAIEYEVIEKIEKR